MKKVVAVILLLVGIGLVGLSAFGFLFSEDRAQCNRLRAEAMQKLNEAIAAEGTPREAELLKDARTMSETADMICGYARQFYQKMTLAGLGGLVSIIVAIVLLVLSRKRTA
jgi:hypothetical protein